MAAVATGCLGQPGFVERRDLDQLDQFRSRGVGSSQETGEWMHAFSEILTSPPSVEILRIEDAKAA